MLQYVREGDLIIVQSMDRLARNLDDLRKLVKDLTTQGVQVQFIKENMTFTNEGTPISTLFLSVVGAFAEFERALIRERQIEGIAIAKAKGAYMYPITFYKQKRLQPRSCNPLFLLAER